LVNDHAAAEQNGAFLEFADRGFPIGGGRVRLSGSPAELIESDAVKSACFGLGWIGSSFYGIDDPIQPIVSTKIPDGKPVSTFPGIAQTAVSRPLLKRCFPAPPSPPQVLRGYRHR
jgi:hypothetical protein